MVDVSNAGFEVVYLRRSSDLQLYSPCDVLQTGTLHGGDRRMRRSGKRRTELGKDILRESRLCDGR